MKIQVLSDLHLETELRSVTLTPAVGADVLVLAGDIDSTWQALSQFKSWPVPVVMIPGNHEFDERDIQTARPALRSLCQSLGIHLLDNDALILTDEQGQRVRFLGSTRWCDFDGLGVHQRERAMKAAGYFVKVMRATHQGRPFDAVAARQEGLIAKEWLSHSLKQPRAGWDRTVVVTHYAPSLQSADPRYGSQLSTASFCNADDDLIPYADLWIHGHLHCRSDYQAGPCHVVCNARGHEKKDEPKGYDGLRTVSV